MKTSKHNIGEIISEHRILKNISQEKLGDVIGKTQQTIFRYENGITTPPKETWEKICEYLKIPVGVYFPEAEAERVKETNDNIYFDKRLKELFALVQENREFLERIGFKEFLKTISELTFEDKKPIEITFKNLYKLIKRSNQNGT